MILRKAKLESLSSPVFGSDVQMATVNVVIAKLTFDSEVPPSETNPIRQVHRLTFVPGDDVPAILKTNNAAVQEQGYDAIPDNDLTRITAETDRLWTPKILAEVKSAKEAAAAEEARREAAAAEEAAKQLPKWKFWAQLEIAGKVDAVREAIAAIKDPTKRAIVGSKLNNTDVYHRDDPLFSDESLLAALNMMPVDIDALWDKAQAL